MWRLFQARARKGITRYDLQPGSSAIVVPGAPLSFWPPDWSLQVELHRSDAYYSGAQCGDLEPPCVPRISRPAGERARCAAREESGTATPQSALMKPLRSSGRDCRVSIVAQARRVTAMPGPLLALLA